MAPIGATLLVATIESSCLTLLWPSLPSNSSFYSSRNGMRASGAKTFPVNSLVSLHVKKHCKMVRHEKSKIEMKRLDTVQVTKNTMNAGTNGCWIFPPDSATSRFSWARAMVNQTQNPMMTPFPIIVIIHPTTFIAVYMPAFRMIIQKPLYAPSQNVHPEIAI